MVPIHAEVIASVTYFPINLKCKRPISTNWKQFTAVRSFNKSKATRRAVSVGARDGGEVPSTRAQNSRVTTEMGDMNDYRFVRMRVSVRSCVAPDSLNRPD